MTSLIFQPDNPCNTTITDRDSGEVRYIVVTEHPNHKTITTVNNAAGETVASSEWRDVQSDILTFRGNSPVPVSHWLKKSMMPFKE